LRHSLHTNVVFFCFFSSDTEEKKAPGRACGDYMQWRQAGKGTAVLRQSLFLRHSLHTNVVFFCFFSSDTEEKKAPGRACGDYMQWRQAGKGTAVLRQSLFLRHSLHTNAVFFCFFSSDTEEKKAPSPSLPVHLRVVGAHQDVIHADTVKICQFD